MRSIKFRGWDAKTGHMLIPIDLSMSKKYWNWLGEHDVPLMQFTGLKDKNGKEVYEDDMVRVIHGGERGENETYNSKERVEMFDGCWKPISMFIPGNTVEVIGNIWENPELIK